MSKPSTGSIRRREGGRHQARFTVDGHVHTMTFDSHSQAQDWLAKMRERHHLGRLRHGLDPTTITLGDALQRYAREVSPSKKNARKEIGAIKRLLKEEPRLCAIPLGHVLIADINDYSQRRMTAPSTRTGQPVCAATVRNDLAIIGNLFTVARARWGFEALISPVCRGARPPGDNARSRRVSPCEERLLYAAAEAYEDDHEATVPIGAIIRFAILTAMRRGEIAGLDWSHVDMARGVMTLLVTKNGYARTVPMRPEVFDLLSRLGPRRTGSVFGCTSASIGTAFGRIKSRAGLEDLRFHDLRHEATSRLFEDAARYGFSDIEIATITGHKTMSMLRRYTHLKAHSIANKFRPQSIQAEVVEFEMIDDDSPRETRRGAGGRFVMRAALPHLK